MDSDSSHMNKLSNRDRKLSKFNLKKFFLKNNVSIDDKTSEKSEISPIKLKINSNILNYNDSNFDLKGSDSKKIVNNIYTNNKLSTNKDICIPKRIKKKDLKNNWGNSPTSSFDKGVEVILIDKNVKNNTYKIIFSNEDEYNGEIKNGKFDGIGIYKKSFNYLYEGEFSEGKKHGKGKIKNDLNVTVFNGSFKNNKKYGYGEEITSEFTYKGEYENGMKNGRGCYITNKLTYEGSFKDNKFSGIGEINYSDGKYFKGNFENGMRNGIGEFHWCDKRKYVGNYKNGLKHGMGKFDYSNGKSIEGIWIQGKLQGEGFIIDNNIKMKVLWKNGKVINYL